MWSKEEGLVYEITVRRRTKFGLGDHRDKNGLRSHEEEGLYNDSMRKKSQSMGS